MNKKFLFFISFLLFGSLCGMERLCVPEQELSSDAYYSSESYSCDSEPELECSIFSDESEESEEYTLKRSPASIDLTQEPEGWE